MKTTNNKLLDNTGNPVSHNRPIWDKEKCVCIKNITPGNNYTCYYCKKEFPNQQEEYIEHLEKELSKSQFGWKIAIELNNSFEKNNQLLSKENQELKDKFDKLNNQYQEEHVNELFDLKEQYETKLKQFLKVVESVLNKAEIYHFDLIDLENGTTALNQPIITELIQEIKNSLQKSTNLPKSQDKSAMNKKGE